jgi:Tol biopolymer transport system component
MAFSYRWRKHHIGSGYTVTDDGISVLDLGTCRSGTYGTLVSDFKSVLSLRFSGATAKSIKVWCDPTSVDLIRDNKSVTPRTNLISLGYKIKSTVVDSYRVAYSLGTENQNESNIFSSGEENNEVIQLTNHSLDSYSGDYNYDGTQIVFVSDRGGRKQIYRANSDGTGAIPLTDLSYNAIDPHWCKVTNPINPTFNKIVFASDVNGGWQLYTMNSDGTGVTRLTNRTTSSYTGDDYSPCWNYDGTRICFVSTRDDVEQIYYIQYTGTGTTGIDITGFSNIDPAYNPASNLISFSSNRTGSYDIYTINDDGSSLTRVTQTGRDATESSWITNTSIAFSSRNNITKNIYSVNSDGTSLVRLTFSASDDSYPQANPSGTRIIYDTTNEKNRVVMSCLSTGIPISRLTENSPESFCPAFNRTGELFAFCKDTGNGNVNIYYTGSDLNVATAIAITNNLNVSWQPSWSVDNLQIVFSTNKDGNYQIYKIDIDGTDQTRLITNAFDCTFPNWKYAASPGDERIIYMSDETGTHQIYSMLTDGTSQTVLTSSGVNIWPSVSPDGTKIAFASNRVGNDFKLYVMNADGSGEVAVGNHIVSSPITWSPDGTKVAFNRDDFEIYSVNISNGSGLSRITYNGNSEFYMSWDPDGTTIVYDSASELGRRSMKCVDPIGGNTQSVDTTDCVYGGSWSKDGSKIVFNRTNTVGRERMLSCSFDGNSKTFMTLESIVSDKKAIYCEANDRVYFERNIPGFNTEICYFNVNTSVITKQYTTNFDTAVLQDVSSDGLRQILTYGEKMYELNNTTLTELITSTGDSIPAEHACYSPDRKRIAIIMPGETGTYPLKPQIFLYTISSKKITKITDTDTIKQYISWRTNSPELIYTDEVSPGVNRLHTLNLNGSSRTRFINFNTDNQSTTSEIGARWCSNGIEVAYCRKVLGDNGGIYITNGASPGGNATKDTFLTSVIGSYNIADDTVYFSGQDGTYFVSGVYAQTASGTAIRTTSLGYNDRFASLSPDASQVVTQAQYLDVSTTFSIYVSDFATPWDRVLIRNSAAYPDWGVNDKVLYTTLVNGLPKGIGSVDPDGLNNTVISSTDGDQQARWSNDASKITFIRGGAVWMALANGTSMVKVVDAITTLGNRSPSFTPNNEEIVFEAISQNGNGEIYRVEAKESGTVSSVSFPGKWPRVDSVSGRVLYTKELTTGNVLVWNNIDGTDEEELTEVYANDVDPRYDRGIADDILFSSDRNGKHQIFSVDLSGVETQIMTNAYNDRHPYMNTTGSYMAFSSDRGTNSNLDIYKRNSSTGIVTRLTTSNGEDYRPCWSQDESKIAFVSTRTGNPQIWIMNADGTNQTQLSTTGDNDFPSISPDNTLVMFSSNRTGKWELYYVPIAGGNELKVDNDGLSVYQADWNFSGSQIVFVGGADNYRYIYTRNTPLNSVGIPPVLLWNSGECGSAYFGEGDTKITFDSNIDGQYEIYKISSSGIDNNIIAKSTYADAYQPAWTKTGSELLYVSGGNGGVNIYKLDANSVLSTLTSHQGSLIQSMHPSAEPIISNPRIVYQTNDDSIIYMSNVYGFSFSASSFVNFGIAIMNFDGSSKTFLTDPNTSNSIEPVWKPDGTLIYYSRKVGVQNYEIWKVSPNGTDHEVVLDGNGDYRYPTFNPSGSKLIYSNNRTGEYQLYEYVLSTGTETRITHDTSECVRPACTSDGQYVIYTKYSPEGRPSLWRINLSNYHDEEWNDANGLNINDASCTSDDAFGSILLQSPDTWQDMPTTEEDAIDLGIAYTNSRLIGFSKKIAIAIKPPAGQGSYELGNLQLKATFKL